jgi:hypothetical protein
VQETDGIALERDGDHDVRLPPERPRKLGKRARAALRYRDDRRSLTLRDLVLDERIAERQ